MTLENTPAKNQSLAEADARPRAMVVDDDAVTATIVGAGLERIGFQVIKVSSGEACLEQIEECKPDLLTIDIGLPGMDGYETCRRARAVAGAGVSIIFLSGHDSLDERLLAYEAGGDDFISKPFNIKEVCRKADISVALKRSWREYAEELQARTTEVVSAMDSLRETNVELAFTRNTLRCRSLRALAELSTQCLSSYGLSCHVQIRAPSETITWTAEGEACQLEKSVFERTNGLGRLFQFKSRLIVNYEKFSLLIVNMPQDDDELAGRLRDIAAMIAEAGDAAVECIAVQVDAIERARRLGELAAACEVSIESLQHKFMSRQKLVRQELQRMVAWIEGMYYRMGLSDAQEELISRTAHQSVDQVMGLLDDGQSLSDEFSEILAELNKAAEFVVEDEGVAPNDAELWF